jgi:ubiquinone/menaquinone biosynthesis C-methylase UbiE
MQSKEHWEHVYSTKATDSVSWFQEHADRSLELIVDTGLPRTAAIIDIGGGASTLVDDLLARGYGNLSVLDLSAAALSAAQDRLGADAKGVTWIEADITKAQLNVNAYDLWHDRAVFHFLTLPEDRLAYIQNAIRAVKPGGHVVVATFAEDGPSQCSGLPVVRYSASELNAAFGDSFALVRQGKEAHRTPFGTVQPFTYCCFRKVGQSAPRK